MSLPVDHLIDKAAMLAFLPIFGSNTSNKLVKLQLFEFQLCKIPSGVFYQIVFPVQKNEAQIDNATSKPVKIILHKLWLSYAKLSLVRPGWFY